MCSSDLDAGGALKYATIDSYEVGGQNWTEDFAVEFENHRGYSLRSWLPAALGYVVGTPAESARFLYDFQRTVSDLYAENYFDYFTQLCHKNGLTVITETYGGPFDNLRAARASDIPTGEFWIEQPGLELPSRMPASSAHFYGKPRVGAESFTTESRPGRWQQDPQQLKQWGDPAWMQGISAFIMHSFVHQPLLNVRPGVTLDRFGSHINRNNTWWPYGSHWVGYINRAQFLLQQKPVVDLLILAGEGRPNNFMNIPQSEIAGYDYDYCSITDLMDNVHVKNGRITTSSGMSYAMLSLGTDRHLSLATLQKVESLLKNGAIIAGLTPSGSPSLVGSTVLSDRKKGNQSTLVSASLANGIDVEDRYTALVEKLWGKSGDENASRRIGSGLLITGNMPHNILREAGILPDFQSDTGIGFIHRRDKNIDIYMVNNKTGEYFTGNACFRAGKGKSPSLWRPDTGTEEIPAVWKEEKNGAITLPLALLPGETIFVIFASGKKNMDTGNNATASGKKAKNSGKKALATGYIVETNKTATSFSSDAPAAAPVIGENGLAVRFNHPARITIDYPDGTKKQAEVKDIPSPIALNTEWTVAFPPNLGAPATINLDNLISLSDHPVDSVKFFSGTATYEKTFNLPGSLLTSNRRLILDLGEVKNLAEIEINNKKVVLWKSPFKYDITEWLHEGENKLIVRITNLWVNRFIGDEQTEWTDESIRGWPKWVFDDKQNSGSGRVTWSTWKGWRKEDKPLPSGLIGPVCIKVVEIRDISSV